VGVVEQGSSTDLAALGTTIDEAENAHEILGLPRDASSAEVRAAYIRLAKEFHPDAHPGDSAAEIRFKRITEAYNELRSSYLTGGRLRAYRARESRAYYSRVVRIAALFFVLIPAAILLVTRSKERSPLIEFRQVEGAAPPRSAIEPGLAPTTPQARSTALVEDGRSQGITLHQDGVEARKAIQESPIRFSNASAADAVTGEISAVPSNERSGSQTKEASFSKGGRFLSSTSFEAHPSEAASDASHSAEDISRKSGALPSFQASSSQSDVAVAGPADERTQSGDKSMVQSRGENDQKEVVPAQPRMPDKRETAFKQKSPTSSKVTASALSDKVARHAFRSQRSLTVERVRDAPARSATGAPAATYPKQAGMSPNGPIYFGVGP